jgi:hypothetical protein
MSDYMGLNSNVGAYDNKTLADLSKCVKWIREYHDWSHYEAANNYYKWDKITTYPHTYTWPEHTDFMKECQRLGISVLIDVLGKPSWAGTSPIPTTSGTGTNASEYLERLEFIGQLVARYGSKKISSNLLETADKATGLNMIKYYEDDNEPDYTWKTPLWTASNYARYCNAVHDGFGVQADADHPLLGIKSVDPNAIHVLAGMASADTIYVSNILKSSGGRIPFDVLNLHWYCTDFTNAYSPENEKYGYEAAFANFFKWKNRVLPNLPVWVTEFGWDTYLAADLKHSYTYAPDLQQANYTLRSFLILLKMGFGKAFLFLDADDYSKNILQYASSGLLADKNLKFAKKTSYYFLATMQNLLGKTRFLKVAAYKEISGTNEIYSFEFDNPADARKVFAIWTRKAGSKTDSGTKTTYSFNPGFQVESAYSVLPADLDLDGDTLNPTITDNKIALNLTETPQFVVVKEKSTSSLLNDDDRLRFDVFPNPAINEVNIVLTVPQIQELTISAFSSQGKLVKKLFSGVASAGTHQFSFGNDQCPGAYFLTLSSASLNNVRKVILLN